MAERPEDMPDTALRGLYESLDLAITYTPGENAIEITLADQTDISGLATQDRSVPLAGAVTDLRRRLRVRLADRVLLT